MTKIFNLSAKFSSLSQKASFTRLNATKNLCFGNTITLRYLILNTMPTHRYNNRAERAIKPFVMVALEITRWRSGQRHSLQHGRNRQGQRPDAGWLLDDPVPATAVVQRGWWHRPTAAQEHAGWLNRQCKTDPPERLSNPFSSQRQLSWPVLWFALRFYSSRDF